jgi:hypothetical protein
MHPAWSSSSNCGMRNCWSMSRYTIPVMVVTMKKGLRAQNTFTFGLSRTCSSKTRGFYASPDSAVLVIDLTTDVKHVFITENYGVQSSLIVLHPTKHLRTEFLTNLSASVRFERWIVCRPLSVNFFVTLVTQ